MRSVITTSLVLWALSGMTWAADEYTVETIDEPMAADELAAEIAEQLAPTGYRVIQDGGRALWEIWPAKKWTLEADFAANAERLYGFEPGQLMGVARLRRRGADFRDQTLSRGVYTLRYALQPVDGNHVGTSPTRDFLLLVRAEDDTSVAPIEAETLQEASATAAGSSHPAMLCLQKLSDDAQAPALRYLEDRELWVLRLAGTAGDDGAPLPIDLVVVGHAAE
jgi:hypothetical protein